MGSGPSSTRVSPIDVQHDKSSKNLYDCDHEKFKDLEDKVSELERELSRSQQQCLGVEARYNQASGELRTLKEELERLNEQLAASRASSASERATQQVWHVTIKDHVH